MRKVILVLAIMLTTLTFAQPGGSEKMTPEQRVDNQVKEMTASLSLSEKQQSELKNILTEQSKKREAKRVEMKAAREKGDKPTDEERAEMKKRMIDEQLEFKTKLKKILSEDQLKKMKEIRQEKGKAAFEKRKAVKKADKKQE